MLYREGSRKMLGLVIPLILLLILTIGTVIIFAKYTTASTKDYDREFLWNDYNHISDEELRLHLSEGH